MTGYLLDTQVLLSWLGGPERLPVPARDAISDPDHRVFVSTAAVWELAIKKSIQTPRRALEPPWSPHGGAV